MSCCLFQALYPKEPRGPVSRLSKSLTGKDSNFRDDRGAGPQKYLYNLYHLLKLGGDCVNIKDIFRKPIIISKETIRKSVELETNRKIVGTGLELMVNR